MKFGHTILDICLHMAFLVGPVLRKCMSHVQITRWAHCQRQVAFLSQPRDIHGAMDHSLHYIPFSFMETSQQL